MWCSISGSASFSQETWLGTKTDGPGEHMIAVTARLLFQHVRHHGQWWKPLGPSMYHFTSE